MRSAPTDLAPERLRAALDEGWHIRPASMAYVPEGGGSHHWEVRGVEGRRHFVTVDDLDDKDWMGDTRPAVLDGLRRALSTATDLRRVGGLDFVVAPVPTVDGHVLRRIDDRYTASVFPYLEGTSYPFGPYPDPGLRDQVLDLMAALHQAPPTAQGQAADHTPRYGGRRDLDAFLGEPDRPWDTGPFSEPARTAYAEHATDLARLVTGFDLLVERTAPARRQVVVTHGEPHPGNLMTVDGRVLLIDWDTAALAPPERDLSLIVPSRTGADRYEAATGHEIDTDVIKLYRLRWYLDDVASTVRQFRNPHLDTADTRRWWEGLASRLREVTAWLALVD